MWCTSVHTCTTHTNTELMLTEYWLAAHSRSFGHSHAKLLLKCKTTANGITKPAPHVCSRNAVNSLFSIASNFLIRRIVFFYDSFLTHNKYKEAKGHASVYLHESMRVCVSTWEKDIHIITLPALMLHEPHNAPLYVIMLSMPQRRIAPDHHQPKKGKTKKVGWRRR